MWYFSYLNSTPNFTPAKLKQIVCIILRPPNSTTRVWLKSQNSKVSLFSNPWRISPYVPSDITQIGKIILLQRHFFYSFLINNPTTFALTKRNKKLKRKVHCAPWKIYIISRIILLIQKGLVHYALYFFEDPDEVIMVWELNEFKTNRRLNYYSCFKKQ